MATTRGHSSPSAIAFTWRVLARPDGRTFNIVAVRKGFSKSSTIRTVAFADFSGNRQFISAGNLTTDARVALILVDYPQQARLKILGRAEILEGDHAAALIERVRDPHYKAVIERVFVIHLDAFDWNCPQHITPRYTAEDIQAAITPLEQDLQRLQQENERLRKQLSNR